jgi:hypothetical protein
MQTHTQEDGENEEYRHLLLFEERKCLQAECFYKGLLLSLGKVDTYVSLRVEGHELHSLIPPHTFDLTDLIGPGDTELTVTVYPAPVTKMDGISWPVGIQGPVTVRHLKGR